MASIFRTSKLSWTEVIFSSNVSRYLIFLQKEFIIEGKIIVLVETWWTFFLPPGLRFLKVLAGF